MGRGARSTESRARLDGSQRTGQLIWRTTGTPLRPRAELREQALLENVLSSGRLQPPRCIRCLTVQSRGWIGPWGSTCPARLGKHLPFFLMAYRSAVHESTGQTPATMLFGKTDSSIRSDVCAETLWGSSRRRLLSGGESPHGRRSAED